MQNVILPIGLLLLLFTSCKKERCVTCIAQANSGRIVKYTIECDASNRYLNGYADGLREFYKNTGDTVKVQCVYGQ